MGWLLVVIGIFGVLGGGSGWCCAGFECFLGGLSWFSVVISGYGWLWGVFAWLWVVMGGYEWFWAGFWVVLGWFQVVIGGQGWL